MRLKSSNVISHSVNEREMDNNNCKSNEVISTQGEMANLKISIEDLKE